MWFWPVLWISDVVEGIGETLFSSLVNGRNRPIRSITRSDERHGSAGRRLFPAAGGVHTGQVIESIGVYGAEFFVGTAEIGVPR